MQLKYEYSVSSLLKMFSELYMKGIYDVFTGNKYRLMNNRR